jgi:hypothetical protein
MQRLERKDAQMMQPHSPLVKRLERQDAALFHTQPQNQQQQQLQQQRLMQQPLQRLGQPMQQQQQSLLGMPPLPAAQRAGQPAAALPGAGPSGQQLLQQPNQAQGSPAQQQLLQQRPMATLWQVHNSTNPVLRSCLPILCQRWRRRKGHQWSLLSLWFISQTHMEHF